MPFIFHMYNPCDKTLHTTQNINLVTLALKSGLILKKNFDFSHHICDLEVRSKFEKFFVAISYGPSGSTLQFDNLFNNINLGYSLKQTSYHFYN